MQLKVGGTSWGVRDLKCASKLGEIGLLLGSNQLVGGPLDLMCQVNWFNSFLIFILLIFLFLFRL